MKKITFLIVLLVLTALTNVAVAQKGKPKPSADTSVTSKIENIDPNFGAYNIQNDNLGSYLNGTNSVESIIQGIGDWELDMLSSTTRRVFYDFSDPVAGSDPNPPANGYYPTRFLAQCSARGGKLTSLALNDSINCPLIVAIDVGTTRYSLRFNAVNYPGTNDVTWSCTSTLNGKCDGWRMPSDPSGNGGKLVAQLLTIVRKGNKTTEDPRGRFNFSFDVSLTNP